MRQRPDSLLKNAVITGVGVLTAIGEGRRAFADGLRKGLSGIRPIVGFATADYPWKAGGEVVDFQPERHLERRQLRRMDRASQLALVAAEEAVGDAGLDLGAGDPARGAVVMGTTLGGMLSGERYHREVVGRGKGKASRLLDFPTHAVADRLSRTYGLAGPSLVFSSACASGAWSVGYGASLIQTGDADVVLAGGVDTLSPFTQAGFGVLKLLIADGERIRPFDRHRCGFALGEGAAILVLEEREAARRRGARIYAEIGGYGFSSDAYHMTAPDRTGAGAAAAMRGALATSGLPPAAVDYVNAHGTATPQNDAVEMRAIVEVFGHHASRLAVSSTKSMIGHTLGASGSIEIVATVVAMSEGFVPPTINYETPDPEFDLDCVPNASRPGRIDVALSNSFGFGGANASVLLRRPPDRPAATGSTAAGAGA